jgi:hypothetical protein
MYALNPMEGNASISDVRGQIEAYRVATRVLSHAHNLAAGRNDGRHRGLGVPVVAITALVSTSVFASVNTNPQAGWKIATGAVALVASILSALLTFLGFGELASKHRASATRYGDARRRCEFLLLKYPPTSSENERVAALADVQALLTMLEAIEEESPNLPRGFYDKARDDILARDERRAKAPLGGIESQPA